MVKAHQRAERKLAFVKAQMRLGEEWSEITIANVSSSGLMAKCSDPPEVGTEVEIRRRGALITGQVVWATRTRFGVSSFEVIEQARLLAESGLQSERRKTERPEPDRRANGRWWCWQRAR